MAETVFMTLDPKTGERTLRVEGVEGGACEDITKALMQANEVKEHEYTDDMCRVQESPDFVEQGE